jgi:hypothetical protein
MKTHEINLSVLMGMVEQVIDGYKARGIHSVDLGQWDTYLMIATEDMFDVYTDPPKPLPIGSLTDDILGLQDLMKEDDPLPTSVDLERLGNLFRAISEAVR